MTGEASGCEDHPVTHTPRILIVMRHSKAEVSGPTDHDRRLSERGRADAVDTGTWLSGALADLETPLSAVDAAVVSSAQRTRETYAGLAEGAGWELAADFTPGLYTAGPDSAFDLVRELDPSVGSALLLGHNPTMAVVAQLLDNGDGDESAQTAMTMEGFPTSSVAIFAIDGDWTDLDEGGGRLLAFHRP